MDIIMFTRAMSTKIKVLIKPKAQPTTDWRANLINEDLKTQTTFKTDIMTRETLKDAHIHCLDPDLRGQQYGLLLETYIINKFGFTKNRSQDCTGDACKDGKNYEIKVSMGGRKHNMFHFNQIRPTHNIDYYILTAYHLNEKNREQQGELFIFRVPGLNLKHLIVTHGSLSHGTMKEYGKITLENLNQEYSLRPKMNDKCWMDLLSYRIQEEDLKL